MYAYFAKGATVGQLLTRRILREITSIPGIMLDFMFAMFWIPDYTSYWDTNSAYIEYADGTRMHGVMRGFFGWIGELLGFVIGAPIGAIIGTALFFPDLLLRGFLLLKTKLYDSLDEFAVFIGKTTFFENLNVYEAPSSYSQKAWNLGVATIGMVLTTIPYIAAKALEFFLPFLPLSGPIAYIGSELGGLAGWAIGALLYMPAYLLNRCTDLIELGRNAIFKSVALVYAKSEEAPVGAPGHRSDCCVPDKAVHSDEFLEQVEHYRRTSWAKLIFGPLKGEASSAKKEKDSGSNNELLDPITFEPLGVNGTPTVIDPHGHTFNDDQKNGAKGIRFWVRNHRSCPIDRQYLTEGDLIPNRAFNDLASQINFSKQ
ncbi:hypothetical protein [Fluoribacter gormanii]|uniref:Uncharacterized protein n=1 Tax=Fluoribacter gormanii TaxID=464 RepID=A0A377GK34_9GAMM|nr:hypothetical protein [Fluoribacter gormanii]KTD02492.1 hypothetical protein Lgor_1784 [Fluoribacter gormanii]SIR45637.1 hypothetical protein SAMN05421777_11296 [Fluoribacter gormanii]STO25176.1 Uncharacterised protein [Fluoribacter gormanii]